MNCSLLRKIKKYVLRHHWKSVHLLCFTALIWQLSGIFSEWINPSHSTTSITETHLRDMDFPLIFKICPDPAFDIAKLEEEGYETVWRYFAGWSMFNDSVYGWAGHTNTSETRGTVQQIYQKVQNFPEAEKFIDR